MISGSVTADGREPVVTLTVVGARGAMVEAIEVEAVVDTGFDGELALSAGLIERLSYPYLGHTSGELADGSERQFHHFAGRIY